MRILGVFAFLASSEALRVLVVFPMTSKSHSILGHGIANRLLEAGHEVVHVTAIPSEKSVKNLREIPIRDMLAKMAEAYPENLKAFSIKNMVGKPNFGDTMFFFELVFNIHRLVFEEENIVEFFSDPKEKFDAVILEWFYADFVAGIAPLFECPLIWFGSTEAHWQLLKLVDSPPNPAYSADLFSLNTPPLTFWGRVMELWMMVKKTAMISFRVTPREKEVYDSIFSSIASKRGVSLPGYEDAVYNGSFLFINSHPSIGTPFSLPQNAKYIGGYHVDNKIDPLPEPNPFSHCNMNEYQTNTDANFIIYTRTTSVITVIIHIEKGQRQGSTKSNGQCKTWRNILQHGFKFERNSLLQMFAKLKQTVIWKFEEELDKVPANIQLVKWAPQQSIFAHPNLKFFITHGGQLSTTEAIHYGVPVIGIPTFGDQFVNMDAVERKGFGIKLKLADDIAGQLSIAIAEMLSNSSYKQRAKELSQIYHDRPVSPSRELVHWVEHVVRTRGAPHLRSLALMLPWYQKAYLDLLALTILIVTLLINTAKNLIPNKTKSEPSKKKE